MHPQAVFADAVNSLAARFAAASNTAWDDARCASEAEEFWRQAIRHGWRLGDEKPLVTSATPAAADVLAESRQRLAHGQVPSDETRRAAVTAAKAALTAAKAAVAQLGAELPPNDDGDEHWAVEATPEGDA
jgi:hypothetical protein